MFLFQTGYSESLVYVDCLVLIFSCKDQSWLGKAWERLRPRSTHVAHRGLQLVVLQMSSMVLAVSALHSLPGNIVHAMQGHCQGLSWQGSTAWVGTIQIVPVDHVVVALVNSRIGQQVLLPMSSTILALYHISPDLVAYSLSITNSVLVFIKPAALCPGVKLVLHLL